MSLDNNGGQPATAATAATAATTEPTATATTAAAQQGNTGAEPGNSQQNEKTFTQAEVDKIISERLSRAKKGMPTDDEMKDFKAWKASQQTEAEKAAEKEKEYADTKSKLTTAEQRWKLVESGYNPANGDDFDYLLYKLGKDENLTIDELKKTNPPKAAQTKTVSSSSSMNSTGKKADDQMARIRKAAGLKP